MVSQSTFTASAANHVLARIWAERCRLRKELRSTTLSMVARTTNFFSPPPQEERSHRVWANFPSRKSVLSQKAVRVASPLRANLFHRKDSITSNDERGSTSSGRHRSHTGAHSCVSPLEDNVCGCGIRNLRSPYSSVC